MSISRVRMRGTVPAVHVVIYLEYVRLRGTVLAVHLVLNLKYG